jgi:hypothetical protein
MQHVQFLDGSSGRWPWARQMPGTAARWGQSQYHFGDGSRADYDWLVVFGSWEGDELSTEVPLERRIFVAGEPESFHRYQSRFLNQFGTVLTTQRGTRHANTVFTQVGINWFAGVEFGADGSYTARLRFEDFLAEPPEKTRLCSVVTSGKAMTAGHRQRLAFVERLQHEFAGQIDFYGRDSRPLADKDLALAPYRFHIAIENSVADDYWTEKFADPILRNCFPIYCGCPNMADYFDPSSYSVIDLSRPEEAIANIRQLLASAPDAQRELALNAARQRLLYQHNIFALLEAVYPQVVLRYPGSHVRSTQLVLSDHACKNLKFSRRLRRGLRTLFGGA